MKIVLCLLVTVPMVFPISGIAQTAAPKGPAVAPQNSVPQSPAPRQAPPTNGTQVDREAERKAFESCLTITGFKRPEPGTRLSDADQEKFTKCMLEKGFKKPEPRTDGQNIFKECVEKNNLKMPSRENPHSEADRKKVDACLREKGVAPPATAPAQPATKK